jgi:hypothetical protein
LVFFNHFSIIYHSHIMICLSTPHNDLVLSTLELFSYSTLSTKRDLGPLDYCLGHTLSHLGLWPSATISILFHGDDEEEWTLLVRSVKNPNDQIKLNFLRAMDKVALLKKRVAYRSEVMRPWTSLKLIYGGKVLNDEDSLIHCGMHSGDTVLCLKLDFPPSPLPSPQITSTPILSNISSSVNTSVSENHQNVNNASEDENHNNHPLCRICYGAAEIDSPLISPCRCSGSIGLVHLECLNSWRRLAPTEASYRRCDQCGYEYRFERTRLAEFLLSKTGVWSLAIFFCILLLYMGSYAVYYSPHAFQQFIVTHSWIPQLPRVFMLGNRRLPIYQWSPTIWMKVNHHLEFLKGGAFFFATLGFLQYIADEFLHWYVHRQLFGGFFNMHTAMMLSWLWSLRSGELSRIVVVVGFAGCAHVVAMSVHAKSKELAQRLGERMLSVE